MDLGQNYSQSYTKEELISALFNGPGTLVSPITSKHMDSPSIFKGGSNESMVNGLSINEAPLKKVFENYCSFGEPLNLTYLKSSKLVKLFRECGLVQDQSELSASLQDRAL